MQAILEDPLALGMLIFGVFLNLAALGMRWEKKRVAQAAKNQAQ
jgi:hypothetical protein